jgi:hypothetical protein
MTTATSNGALIYMLCNLDLPALAGAKEWKTKCCNLRLDPFV